MPTETADRRLSGRSHRVDPIADAGPIATSPRRLPGVLLVVMAAGFVVLGGGSQEPGDAEARLGLASGAGLAPFAQVMGGWDPTIAPGRVLLGQAWARFEGGPSTLGAIRWPEALAAVAVALLMARRAAGALGERAGLFVALAMLGSFAMIDRSSATGLDLVAGLAVVAALDRLLSKGSDWLAGGWAAIAILAGGWPGLAAILLPAVALGRPGSSLSKGLLIPPVAAFAAWSFWAWNAARVEVWASSLMLPLMQPPSWTMGLGVVAVGLPFTPLASLVAWPAIRSRWSPEGKGLILRWLQAAGIALLAGTLVPGLATACKTPVLVALALAAGAVLDAAWEGGLGAGPRRAVLGLSAILGVGAGGLMGLLGAYLAAAQPYYRPVGFVLVVLGLVAVLMSLDAAWMGATRRAVGALVLVAVAIKAAHCGFYVPELVNYRSGQGPWGRAVGQHVPPNWPIYVFHAWPPALALATEHPVKQLPAEMFLLAEPAGVKFVLLQDEEFKHWPQAAPKIRPVRTFQDERGRVRVLARTEGKLVRRIDND